MSQTNDKDQLFDIDCDRLRRIISKQKSVVATDCGFWPEDIQASNICDKSREVLGVLKETYLLFDCNVIDDTKAVPNK